MSASSIPQLVELLAAYRFTEASEVALHAGVVAVLTGRCEFQREVCLSEFDRIDFLIGRIGLECKIGGPLAAVTRQLFRYAQSPMVDSLILLTTRSRHAQLPPTLNGKEIVVVATLGGFR